jgi:1,4-alpha-glucan branching enzyme
MLKSVSRTDGKAAKEVPFEFYAPNATDVRIAGTFNNWDTSKNLLRKDREGRWRLTLKLKPGQYEYRYLVDGNWENDQRPVGCIPNAFGTWNCVLEIS